MLTPKELEDLEIEAIRNADDPLGNELLKDFEKHRFDDEREPIEIKSHGNTTPAEYDFETIKSSKAFLEADSKNCVVVLPAPNQLFIDIDDEAGARAYCRNIGKFEQHVAKVVEYTFKPSKSGARWNFHYVLTLADEFKPLERILFQVLLGSDRTRETLSYIRYLNGDPHPTLFFEKKNAGELPAAPEA